MTNGEKFKTAKKRKVAFSKFCAVNECSTCPLNEKDDCKFGWLELEAPNDSAISKKAIAATEKVLVDNGIDEDEASTVLQAIGYALLDTELYPNMSKN